MQKKVSYHYLHFTRKERRGILILLLLMVLFAALPYLYLYFFPEKPFDDKFIEDRIASLELKKADSTKNFYKRDFTGNVNSASSYQNDLFYFDPNHLPASGWKKLGVKDKTIATIQNYLSKGGRFHEPGDLNKIWGIDKKLSERLIPFVQIRKNEATKKMNSFTINHHPDIFTKIDINEADSIAFVLLPGIGPKLAARIMSFREKLGGFYSVNQVAETFGLHDSVFQNIKTRLIPGKQAVRKININSATVDELKNHPYIPYSLANAIVQYRLQHGLYKSTSQINQIMMVTEEQLTKLFPYLAIE